MGRNGEGNADSDAMEEGDGMNVQISQDYLSSLMQEPPIVPITQEEAQRNPQIVPAKAPIFANFGMHLHCQYLVCFD